MEISETQQKIVGNLMQVSTARSLLCSLYDDIPETDEEVQLIDALEKFFESKGGTK